MAWLWDVLISLVVGIYKIVQYTYQIFLVLAKTNIFENYHYEALTQKIYVILGVVMLFIIAYNFLILVVDPDKNKGGASVEKLLKNILISFIMIVVCPAVFSFAFKVSDAVMNQGIITKFFSNTKVEGYDNNSIKNGGYLISGSVFSAFFNAASGDDNDVSSGGDTLEEVKEKAITTGNYSGFYDFSDKINDTVEFNWFVSLIAGGYLCYVIISFCFDLAVRVCKLAFYQIIAPIAIAARILPDKESIYKNWFKATTQTFIALFIRVFIMNLGIYLISIFSQMDFFETYCNDCSFAVATFGKAFIILGIVTFMQAASKLLDDIFGFGDVSLGIKDKLKSGGAFAAGAALGGGVTSMARNATHAVSNVRKAYKGADGKGGHWGAAIAAGARGVGSTVAGGVSGTARGMKGGQSAGSWSEMWAKGQNAAVETVEKRDAREAYRAAHGLRDKNGNVIPIIGGIGSLGGHIADAASDVVKWAGINNEEEIKAQNQSIMALVNAVDGVKDTAKDVITADAIQKNKSNNYGISTAESWSTSKIKDINGNSVTVTTAYNSEVYRKMQHAIDDARATGASYIDYTDQAGVTNRFTVGDFQGLQGLYLKEFSERVANQAAKTEENWKSMDASQWYFDPADLAGLTGAALEQKKKEIVESYQLQLDKVRGQAITLRQELKDGISNAVVSAANEAAQAYGTQQITVDTVDKENLVFNGDSAISKIGDKAKLQMTANKERLSKEKAKQDKK